MKKSIFLLLSILFFQFSYTQESGVLNIKAFDLSQEEGANPRAYTKAGNNIFLVANDGFRGYELWKLDESTQKLTLVMDIYEGYHSSLTDYSIIHGVIDDVVLFFARKDNDLAWRLWRSDGTEEGTYQVADIKYNLSAEHIKFTDFNGLLYFTGRESYDDIVSMWTTDGTVENTHKFGLYEGAYLEPSGEMIVSGNYLYFFAKYNGFLQLFRTDGTNDGIEKLSNFQHNAFIYQNKLFAFQDKVYFYASDTAHGNELWQSDGTIEGTHLFVDLIPGPIDSAFGIFAIDMDDYFLFLAKTSSNSPYRVYKSDGTEEGTELLFTQYGSNAYPIFEGEYEFPVEFGRLGDKVLLSRYRYGYNNELWVLDGAAGTVEKLKVHYGDYKIGNYVTTSDDLYIYYYAGSDQSDDNNIYLWKTNGEINGTERVSENHTLYTAGNGTAPPNFQIISDNNIYLSVIDEVNGSEVWRVDLENDQFHLVDNINKLGSTEPRDLYEYKDKLFFLGKGNVLYLSDGTLEGTKRLNEQNFHHNVTVNHGLVFNDDFYFLLNQNEGGYSLYRINNVDESLELIKTLTYNSHSFQDSNFVEYEGRIYFNYIQEGGQKALWTSDGTSEGTFVIADSVGALGNPWEPFNYNDHIYYTSNHSFETRNTVRRMNGPESIGDIIITLPHAGIYSGTAHILDEINDGVLIYNHENMHDDKGQLFLSKGEQSNTIKLMDIKEHFIMWMDWEQFGGKFIIRGSHSKKVYVTDGTPESSYVLGTFKDRNFILACGNYAYIPHKYNESGSILELAQTDGTVEGTFKLTDYEGGPYMYYSKKHFGCYNNEWLIFANNGEEKIIKITNGNGVVYEFELNFVNDLPFDGYFLERIDEVFIIGDQLYLSILKRNSGMELYTVPIQDLGINLNVSEVEELHPIDRFTIYPNPTTDILNLKLTDETSEIKSIKLYDLNGKQIDVRIMDSSQMDLRFLSKGIYLIEVTTSTWKETKKIIIK